MDSFVFEDMLFSWGVVSFTFLSIFISLFFVYNLCSNMSLDKTRISHYRNRTVLLTGATSGIGLSMAIELYKVNAHLILVGRNKEALEGVITEYLLPIASNSPNCAPPPVPNIIVADLSLPESLPRCPLNKNAQNLTEVQKCDEEGNSMTIVNLINDLSQISPQIDAVICCAGLSMRDSVANMTGYAEQYIMNVNYTSIVTLCRMLIKQRFLQDGNIMVVSSIQGLLSIPWRSSYAASKAALQAYFTTLRHEFALQSVPISITIVSPGHVNTNLSMNAMTGSGTAHNQVDENTAHGIDPDDVARLALQATIKKYPELWLFPPTHKLIVLIQHWFPKFSNFFIRKARKDMIPVAADLNSSANKTPAKKNLGDNKKTN